MDQALVVIEEVLEVLPAPRDVPDSEKGTMEILSEGMHEGALFGRDLVRRIRGQLLKDSDDMAIDVKLMNLGSQTAGWMMRIGMRGAEEQGRNRRDDVVGRLLKAIEEERGRQK